jgi:hypothetical protein
LRGDIGSGEQCPDARSVGLRIESGVRRGIGLVRLRVGTAAGDE